MLVAVLAFAALAVPATAEARTCGAHRTSVEGATVTVKTYGSASCSFAAATARRFYAVDGVPRRLRVRGIRLMYRGTRSGPGWTSWRYSGRRDGRSLTVIIKQIELQASPKPTSPEPVSTPPVSPPPVAPPSTTPPPTCDPNYQGACLDPYAYDYDCLGGSGDGPLYTGLVVVVGYDRYDLDRDGDGFGCE
jgi:hypothetical protein